ncbi:MAG: thioesterase [Actinobacteria bacterium]|nr:thioesterase [Actinomycetota bacterium]
MEHQIGAWAEVTTTVSETDTAIHFGSGDVAVLATPRVVALVEEAACNAIRTSMEEGRTTVGTRIELDHLLPSPVGSQVIARAEVVSVDGHWIEFAVAVTMDGREVARGRHYRVGVARERFETP